MSYKNWLDKIVIGDLRYDGTIGPPGFSCSLCYSDIRANKRYKTSHMTFVFICDWCMWDLELEEFDYPMKVLAK